MGEPPTHTQRGGGRSTGTREPTGEEAREWGEGKERRETENQTARWDEADESCKAQTTGLRAQRLLHRHRHLQPLRATPGVLARALQHLPRPTSFTPSRSRVGVGGEACTSRYQRGWE